MELETNLRWSQSIVPNMKESDLELDGRKIEDSLFEVLLGEVKVDRKCSR